MNLQSSPPPPPLPPPLPGGAAPMRSAPPAAPAPVASPWPFASTNARTKLIIWTCIFAAVCYVIQSVGPRVAKFLIEPYGALGKVEVSAYQVNNAALWDGRIWYVRNQGRLPKRVTTVLVALPADGKSQPQDAAFIEATEPWLLAGPDRLWIMSDSGLAYYRNGAIQPVSTNRQVKPACRPFLYGDTIAVLEQAAPGQYDLLTLDDGQWRKREQYRLGVEADKRENNEDLQVVPSRDRLFFFCRPGDGKTVFCRSQDDDNWQIVGACLGQWKAVSLEGQETLFYHDLFRSGGPYVIGLRRNQQQWDEYFQQKIDLDIGMGICPIKGGGDFILLRRVLPLGIVVTGFERDKEKWQFKDDGNIGMREDYPVLSKCIYLIGPLSGLILAILLTAIMGRLRTNVYISGPPDVRFASPLRRVLAAGIDAVVVVAPLAVFALARVGDFLAQPLSLGGIFNIVLQVGCAGLLWFPMVFFFLCMLEGSRGCTPGKWILGIRVLMPNLQPCGMGRALLRNLLRLADAFGWYIVGMIAMASTVKCQRLGDLAAGTIVVRRIQIKISPR